MKAQHKFLLLVVGLFFNFQAVLLAQTHSFEKPPLFPDCTSAETDLCFEEKMTQYVIKEFQQSTYKESVFQIQAVVSVDESGKVGVIYVATARAEIESFFKQIIYKLPKITAATIDGRPTLYRYSFQLQFPLMAVNKSKETAFLNNNLNEVAGFVYQKKKNRIAESRLNMAFTHRNYNPWMSQMQQVGANNHTASKPFSYEEVGKYVNWDSYNEKVRLPKSTQWGNALFNDPILQLQTEDFWFSLSPVVDFQLGKDTQNKTFVNTRGVLLQGELGKTISFSTALLESQGRFAGYFNDYANTLKPSGGNPAIIPGVGIAKSFKEDAYDFPLSEAYLTFSPSKPFSLQLGYGRNFLGDGYRSLFLSDASSPYPFFKINTTFWKIKYTNLYMWLKDVRPEVTVDRTYATKYIASHYLSWNVNNRLNIGFFESVVWSNTNNRGFDVNFVNPIIFYRSVEFSSSSRSGNALLGLSAKYKWNSRVYSYGQMLLDEFSLGDIKARNKSWKNKVAWQFGTVYQDAFKIKNWNIQLEYNRVRPYVYAHSEVLTNYGHNNQSLGHAWGANFQELLLINRFHVNRWYADLKLTYGIRGFDYNTPTNTLNYGGNIYRDYDQNRAKDTQVTIGQGNQSKMYFAEANVGYLLNPSTNMRAFVQIIHRNMSPTEVTTTTTKSTTTWVSVGVKTDLFNWYFDY